MPTVPGAFEGSRVRAQGMVAPNVPAGAFGAQVGEAMARDAQGTARAAQQVGAFAEAAEQRVNQELLTNRLDSRRGMSEAATEAQIAAEAETTPDGTRRVYGERRAAALARALEGVTDRGERTWREQQFQEVFGSVDRGVVGLTTRRANDGVVASVQATFVTEGQAAARGDPGAGRRVDEALAAARASGAITAAQQQQMRQQWHGGVEMNAFRRMAQADPAGALTALNGGRFPNLTDNLLMRAEDYGVSQQRQQQLEREREERRTEVAQDRREASARSEVAAAEPFLARGIMEPERIARVTEAVRGTPSEAGWRRMQAAGTVNARLATMAPAAQDAAIEAQREVVARPGATRDDLEQLDRMRTARTNVARAYQDDPIGTAVATGLIPRDQAPPPLNISDPATINARVALAETVSAHLGRRVSPFTQADLTTLAQQAVRSQASPDFFTQIITQLRDISDPETRRIAAAQIEGARGEGGRMTRNALTVLVPLASGTPDQRRAALLLTEALTVDRDDRFRRAGESAEMRTALEAAIADPRLDALRAASATSDPAGRDAALRLDAAQGIVRGYATHLMTTQGLSPSQAVSSALNTVFAGRAVASSPGLVRAEMPAEVRDNPNLERTLQRLRTELVERIPLNPTAGAEANAANRERRQATLAGEWVSVGEGHYGLVVTGQYGGRRVAPWSVITTDQLREAVTRGTTGGLLQRRTPPPPNLIEGFNAPEGAGPNQNDAALNAAEERLRRQPPPPGPQAAAPAGAAGAVRLAASRVGQGPAEVREFLVANGAGLDPSSENWCAAFLNASLRAQGVQGSGSNVATSFRTWGAAVATPSQVQEGDVLVEHRGRGAGQVGGHAGLATGQTRNVGGRLQLEMISGNSGNRVGRTWHDAEGLDVRRAPAP